MTNAELKEALLSGAPVVCGGIRYQKLTAIVYRAVSGKILISGELLDGNGNCVVYAPARNIELYEGDGDHAAQQV